MSGPMLVVDTAYLYFRAYYGVPRSLRGPEGGPVNAIRGTLDSLAALVEARRPTHLVCAWDTDWRPQWRVDLLDSYKAHRVDATTGAEEVPEELAVQVPVIRALLEALGIAVLGAAGAEADDVMGTLATRYSPEMVVELASGDRDLTQLVTERVRVLTPVGRTTGWAEMGPAEVADTYGVSPDQYVALAALRGDSSDGIPGVAGIGDKTAATLLHRYGSLEATRERAAQIAAGTLPPDKGALTKKRSDSVLAADTYLDVASQVIAILGDVPLQVDLADLLMPTQVADPAGWQDLVETHGIASVAQRLQATMPMAHT